MFMAVLKLGKSSRPYIKYVSDEINPFTKWSNEALGKLKVSVRRMQ